MERKNMVLLTVIAVATLLVAVVGATFAYFTATVTESRTDEDANGQTTLNTASVANTTTIANISGAAGKFEATDIYPGHTEVAGLKITVDAGTQVETDTTYAIPFVYKVTHNTIGANVKYYLYSADNDETVNIKCTINTTGEGSVQYSENCDFEHATGVGQQTSDKKFTLVATGNLNGNDTQDIQMVDDLKLQSNEKTKDKYYYFILEYENKQDPQNTEMGKTLTGNITILGATKSE